MEATLAHWRLVPDIPGMDIREIALYIHLRNARLHGAQRLNAFLARLTHDELLSELRYLRRRDERDHGMELRIEADFERRSFEQYRVQEAALDLVRQTELGDHLQAQRNVPADVSALIYTFVSPRVGMLADYRLRPHLPGLARRRAARLQRARMQNFPSAPPDAKRQARG